jgi:hypothetical protein
MKCRCHCDHSVEGHHLQLVMVIGEPDRIVVECVDYESAQQGKMRILGYCDCFEIGDVIEAAFVAGLPVRSPEQETLL